METITIREYEPQDWERLIEIHDAARKMELSLSGLDDAFVPLKEAAVNEGLFDYTLRVALIADKVVGFTAYTGDELAWLYTDPEQMRKGIGRALVQYVLDHVDTRPLCIEVLQGNLPALSLYESMGFRTVEVVSGSMPGNESFQVTAHRMEKALSRQRPAGL